MPPKRITGGKGRGGSGRATKAGGRGELAATVIGNGSVKHKASLSAHVEGDVMRRLSPFQVQRLIETHPSPAIFINSGAGHYYGLPPLQALLRGKTESSPVAQNYKRIILDILIPHPLFDVNAVDATGHESPLMAAAQVGDVDILRELVLKGAGRLAAEGDPHAHSATVACSVMGADSSASVTPLPRAHLNHCGVNGLSALGFACRHGHTAAAEYLAAIKGATACGAAAHEAVGVKSVGVLRFLIETARADVNAVDVAGKTALFKAVEHGLMDIAKYLVSVPECSLQIPSAVPIFFALARKGEVECHSLPMLELLLAAADRGAEAGTTADLNKAARSVRIASLLDAVHQGTTLLHTIVAKEAPDESMLRYIGGHSHDATGGDAMARSLALVEALLAAGADVHVRDSRGNTPLHVCGSVPMTKLLLAHGADPMAPNTDGYTAVGVMTQRSAYLAIHPSAAGTLAQGRCAFDKMGVLLPLMTVDALNAAKVLGFIIGRVMCNTYPSYMRLDPDEGPDRACPHAMIAALLSMDGIECTDADDKPTSCFGLLTEPSDVDQFHTSEENEAARRELVELFKLRGVATIEPSNYAAWELFDGWRTHDVPRVEAAANGCTLRRDRLSETIRAMLDLHWLGDEHAHTMVPMLSAVLAIPNCVKKPTTLLASIIQEENSAVGAIDYNLVEALLALGADPNSKSHEGGWGLLDLCMMSRSSHGLRAACALLRAGCSFVSPAKERADRGIVDIIHHVQLYLEELHEDFSDGSDGEDEYDGSESDEESDGESDNLHQREHWAFEIVRIVLDRCDASDISRPCYLSSHYDHAGLAAIFLQNGCSVNITDSQKVRQETIEEEAREEARKNHNARSRAKKAKTGAGAAAHRPSKLHADTRSAVWSFFDSLVGTKGWRGRFSKHRIETIRLAIDQGLDVTDVTLHTPTERDEPRGMTLLMGAASLRCLELARLFIENGASIADTDDEGNTAFDYLTLSGARLSRHRALAKLLKPSLNMSDIGGEDGSGSSDDYEDESEYYDSNSDYDGDDYYGGFGGEDSDSDFYGGGQYRYGDSSRYGWY